MNGFVTWLISIFKPVEQEIVAEAVAVAAKVGAAFAGVLGQQPADQQKILHDAMAAFTADIDDGKGWSEAAADALNVFFNEEQGEFTKVTKALFDAFLAATTPAQ